MDNIQKIMDIMEQIEYGFLDNDGNNIFDDLEIEYTFNKVYYLI